jgi:hypothetical protein
MRVILAAVGRASVRLLLLLAVLASATFLVFLLFRVPSVLTDKSEWRDLGIFTLGCSGVIVVAVLAALVRSLIYGWRGLRGRR